MLFYILFLIILAPWPLLFVGGVRRMLRTRHLYGRLQCYGATFILFGKIAHLAIFAPHFGADPRAQSDWAYWFPHAEWGCFFIGLLFFGLGFFLDRRPRPGFKPWPIEQRRLALWGLFLGFATAFLVFSTGSGEEMAGPSLGLDRFAMALGAYPFAFAYEQWSRRDTTVPPRNPHIGI